MEQPIRAWKPIRTKLQEILLHSPFQRPVDKRRAARIAANWDPRKANALKLGQFPEGLLACADGQHTGTAMRIRFGNPWVDAEYVPVRDQSDFAQLVSDMNPPDAVPLGTKNKFWINLEAGDANAIALRDATIEAGFCLARAPGGPLSFRCIPALMSVYLRDGEEAYQETLRFLADAFPGKAVNQEYTFLGTHLFVQTMKSDPRWDRGKVVRVLSDLPFATISNRAKETKRCHSSYALSFATVLLASYNENNGFGRDLKTNLPE